MVRSGRRVDGSSGWKCRVNYNEKRRHPNLPPDRVEHKRAMARRENMSPEQVERERARNRKKNKRRIYVGDAYRGSAKTEEQAALIQSHISRRLQEFRQKQSTERSTTPL